MSINSVTISGNLTADPVKRSGKSSVLGFTVAVNGRVRKADGEWEDRPDFIRCVVFGNRADALEKYLHKGTKVVVNGRLRYSTWETDGQKRSSIDVVVNELEFMSARGAENKPAASAEPDYYDAPF